MSNNRYEITQTDGILYDDTIRKKAKLLYVSSAKYGGDWHSMPHTHTCSELFYVIEGSGQFLIENEIYPVTSNDLVVVNQNVLHTELSLNASALKYIVLGVSGLELKGSAEENEPNFCIVNFKNMRDTILLYLQNILMEIEAGLPGHEIICQDLMEILIVLFTRQTNYATTLSAVPQKKTNHLCDSTKRYIDSHYSENLTLDHLADLSHVSKYYLAHVFNEVFGISPINYLIAKRIQKAEHLLQTTDYPLSLISSTTGFSSSSYFAQVFKKQKGCTPSEYRKQIKKDGIQEEEEPAVDS